LPNAHQIAVVDVATGKQVANWRANFPMALDDQGAVIATVFRRPVRLVLLDVNSGTATINLETCGEADDVFFDSRRRRIYVSCGEGSVDVLEQGSTGYHRLSLIETASGARTSLFVPELDRLFVAACAGFFGFGSDNRSTLTYSIATRKNSPEELVSLSALNHSTVDICALGGEHPLAARAAPIRTGG
jgi:hypothetical protein